MKFNVPRLARFESGPGDTRHKTSDIDSRGEINEHAGERRQQGFIDRIKDRSYVPREIVIDKTPNGANAYFEGYRGESKCKPNLETEQGRQAARELEKYGQDGINYKDGRPDFSPVSEASVTIDNMSEHRLGPGKNFAQAKDKLAEQWNRTKREGRSNWTAREVEDWCKASNFTIHERADMKTCDFVNADIHKTFSHCGGVAECKARDAAKTSNDFMRGADFFAIFDN